MLPYLLLALNLCAFLLYAEDKRRARRKQYRIRERALLLAAAVGPLGALLGMYICRHKTQKTRFRVLVPLFLALWALALCLLFP